MKRLILVVLLLAVQGFALDQYSGWCERGNKTVSLQGIASSTLVQQSYPNTGTPSTSCKITVYDHGTTNASTIYSDNNSTPLGNPFYVNTNGSYQFFAANGRYDVTGDVNGTTIFTVSNLELTDIATVGDFDGIRFPDRFPGNSPTTQINAAIADIGAAAGTMFISSNMAAGYDSSSPLPTNVSIFDFRTGTSAVPITSAISQSPNVYIKRFDNTTVYTQQGDNIVGGFNTWGSLMRIEATSSPNPASTVGAFATLISTVSSSMAGNVAPNFNVAGGDSRLAGYFGGWRDTSTDRAGQAINVLQECGDINTHACNAAEFDLNQRGSDDTPTGVSYIAQFASGGSKKITAGIGISSTNPTVNGMRYGLVIGGYLTSGIIVNPSLTVPTAPAVTLNGTVGSAGVLQIGGWDFNAFKYVPVNDTAGVVGTLYKADGITRRMSTLKRGAISFFDTTNFEGTATINFPHGKCIGWENLATGSTINGMCSNAGDDGFAIGGVSGVVSVVPTLNANSGITVGTTHTVTLGGTTVGSLPSAAANAFAMVGVTDSTAISAEGQACVGGSSTKAIAISNGTSWKCF